MTITVFQPLLMVLVALALFAIVWKLKILVR